MEIRLWVRIGWEVGNKIFYIYKIFLFEKLYVRKEVIKKFIGFDFDFRCGKKFFENV